MSYCPFCGEGEFSNALVNHRCRERTATGQGGHGPNRNAELAIAELRAEVEDLRRRIAQLEQALARTEQPRTPERIG